MKNKYEDYSDSDIVQALKTRLELNQGEIAQMFYVSGASISRALSGKKRLRPAVRQGMIDLLVKQDNTPE